MITSADCVPRLKELSAQWKGPDTGPTVYQGSGNRSNERPYLVTGINEGTFGAFSQSKSDTTFYSTLSGRRYSMILHAQKKGTKYNETKKYFLNIYLTIKLISH